MRRGNRQRKWSAPLSRCSSPVSDQELPEDLSRARRGVIASIAGSIPALVTMGKQPESRLQRRVRAALEEQVGGFWWKVHGSAYQPSGIPDLAGVVAGRAVFVEVKTSTGSVSDVQRARMRQLRNAGAVICVSTSPEDAVVGVMLLMATSHRWFCLSCHSIQTVGSWGGADGVPTRRCRTCEGDM